MQNSVQPDKAAYQIALLACGDLGTTALAKGKSIHAGLSRAEETQPGMQCSLINMYAKCGDFSTALAIHDTMLVKGQNDLELHNASLWNTMISACGMHGYGKRALELFAQMQSFSQPNEVTFIVVLNACAHSGLVDDALHFYSVMSSQFRVTPTNTHQCCVVDTLTRAGNLGEAEDFILSLPHVDEPSSFVMWVTLLAGCRLHV